MGGMPCQMEVRLRADGDDRAGDHGGQVGSGRSRDAACISYLRGPSFSPVRWRYPLGAGC
jgi:hypothetical protein